MREKEPAGSQKDGRQNRLDLRSDEKYEKSGESG